MIENTGELVYQAARLIQFGLRPKTRPVQEPEYQQLITRFLDHAEFRGFVKEMASGLGMSVLDASELGLVLGPTEDSVFAVHPASILKRQTPDDRLLDGLVQVAIAATVFPRAQDLEDTSTSARPPVTVDEVEESVRALCQLLDEEAKGRPDPTLDEGTTGLYEAWRVYNGRSPARETPDKRQAARTTRRIIETNLDLLHEWGCFTQTGTDGAYQSTWRYQVLVKELAATRTHERVRKLLEGGTN